MRLLLVFLITSLTLQPANSENAQPPMISLDIKDMSIKGILEQIEKESGYSFFYNNQLVDVNRKVSISVKNENIFSILDRIFKDANIEYSLVENRIVLSPKKQDVQEKQKGDAVSGKVLDVSGNPIIGASILVQGTSTGTITDLEGNYSLRVPDNTVLVISSIGFVSQTVTVGKQTTINVTLEDDKQSLNEVVVVGYGTQRKGNLTGAISSVKSNELNVAPSSSAINSLTGRLSGLVSKQSSGQPGHDQANIKIRGFSDDAIWIVDGIEMDFNRIDPSQIESISILKDASASIYGSRAGNGVILVTTKRGLTQKPTITVNSSLTFQGITTMPKPVSSGQYATLQREAWLNAGNPESTAPYTEEQIQKYYAGNDPQYVNTDWYKYLVRKWSPLHKDNISVRGGTEKIKYYGFLGYMNQESIWKRNGGNYEKFNLQSNIDASITDRLTLQLDISAIKSIDKSPMRGEHTGQDSVWQDFWNTLPIYPAELPDKTKISYADGKGTGGAHITTNMALSGYSMNENLSFDGTIALKYESKFVEGLSAKYFANYYKSMTFSKVFSKPSYFYRYDVASDTYISAGGFGNSASIRQTDSRNSMLTQQISLNFENAFGEHMISALAMCETIDYGGNWMSAARDQLLTPAIEELFVGSTETMRNDGASSEMGRKSFIGRVNYSYANKYLLETTFRADASAKFSSSKRWGYFPSVSVGWRITEEQFMSNLKEIFNDLKLRVSYGESGNDAVGNFQYMSGYQLEGYYLLGSSNKTGIVTTGLANPDLTWEEFKIYDVGLNFSMLNQLIYGEGDFFYRRRSGIPAYRTATLPPTFGANLPQENLNSMTDRGFEFSIGSAKTFSDFSYDVSANISWSRAKWDHYEEQGYIDADQIRLYKNSGRWVDRTYGYKSDGLFTSQEEIDNLRFDQDNQKNATLKPGDIRYVDVNNDGIISWKDQVKIGKGTMPHWIYGINVSLAYRDFDFSVLFQGAFGYNTYVTLWHNTLTYPKELFENRWSEYNNKSDALFPRLGGASTNNYTSDFFYKKSRYLRLKQMSLGYNLPKEICGILNLQQCRVYLAGVNLLTLHNLRKYHIDPESPSGNAAYYYPQQRTISLGVNISF